MSEFVSTLKDLTAGTIGGCAGIVAGQPLDTIKVRLQSQTTNMYSGTIDCFLKTVRREGFSALFKGMQSPLIGNAPLNAVVFGAYGNMNRLLEKHFPRSEEDKRSLVPSYSRLFVAGSWAGTVQCLVATPVELIKCKLQVQSTPAADSASGTARPASSISDKGQARQFHSSARALSSTAAASAAEVAPMYNGSWDCARKIVRQNGVFGLYRGWWSTVWRDAPSYGGYFASYEYTKFVLNPDPTKRPDTWVLLVAGSVAGIVTWLSTYPFDVLKSVIQTLPDTTPRAETSMWHVAKKYHAQYGIGFFFRGLSPTLLRAVPTNAVTFLVFEESLRALNHIV